MVSTEISDINNLLIMLNYDNWGILSAFILNHISIFDDEIDVINCIKIMNYERCTLFWLYPNYMSFTFILKSHYYINYYGIYGIIIIQYIQYLSGYNQYVHKRKITKLKHPHQNCNQSQNHQKFKARMKSKLSKSSKNDERKFVRVASDPGQNDNPYLTDSECSDVDTPSGEESYDFSASMAQELDWSPNNSEMEYETSNGVTCIPRNIPRKLSRLKKKIKPIFWKFIWCFWMICCLLHWFGFIAGYVDVFDNGARLFCYMLWKLITFCMLLLCQYILYVVKRRLEMCLENDNDKGVGTRKLYKNLDAGRKKIKSLIICEFILSIFLFITCVYEIYLLMHSMDDEKHGIEEDCIPYSRMMSMMIYFPVWTSIHIVLLVYSWINKNQVSKKLRKQKGNKYDGVNYPKTNTQQINGEKFQTKTQGNMKDMHTKGIDFDIGFDMNGECVLVGIDINNLDEMNENNGFENEYILTNHGQNDE